MRLTAGCLGLRPAPLMNMSAHCTITPGAGMFYSHRRVGQPGPITRILCCTKEEYSKLSEVEKTFVPTHWAPSYTVHPRTGDVYHAYNKPLAVLDWMSKV